MKTLFTLFLASVFYYSIDAQPSHENIPFKQQILSTIHKQIDGWNSGTIEDFMQGYAKTDSLRFASDGTVTFGWTNMIERYKKNYSTKEKMGKLSFTDISIDSISKDAAIVFGTWRLEREKDKPWGLFTLVFKNFNGEWKIVHDHTSSGN
jgi:ketosteroid isomerase-like protein